MKIAFFDSGIGGLTVLKEALSTIDAPDIEYIYYADTANAPYGTKGKDEVRRSILDAAAYLADIDILVLACNTATSIAAKELREMYPFPVVGMEPAVKPAVELETGRSGNCSGNSGRGSFISKAEKIKRILVAATPLTLSESKFHELINRVDTEHIVDMIALPELVEFAENFQFDEDIIIPYLKGKMASIDLHRYGFLVLGCTHFPYFTEHFKKVLPAGVEMIDGTKGTVNHIRDIIRAKRAKSTAAAVTVAATTDTTTAAADESASEAATVASTASATPISKITFLKTGGKPASETDVRKYLTLLGL